MMGKLRGYLVEKNQYPTAKRVFAIAIYSWVIVNALVLWPIGEHIWGVNSYWRPGAESGGFSKYFYFLLQPAWRDSYPFLLFMQVAFSITAILGRWPVLSSAIVWLVTMILDVRGANILDGGNNLIHLFLFYLILVAMAFAPTQKLRALRLGLSNAAFVIARWQLVVVYFCASLGKVHGELWPKGVALYYTMNVAEYSHPLLAQLMSRFAFMGIIASYATVFFQISFPFMVWFHPYRAWWLAAGTFLHLGIAFGMGLMSFGFAMCAAYTVFYSEARAQKILNFYRGRRWAVVGGRRC